ncbi:uncharacterized protein LOC127863864 isoform X2 [Dreissena polymorpha]|uniref:uncharacterized protein LOC127863864 isoform X2 n=1 Tax=Dreissena polymorpha TaxID=45954 RepID=UPI0022653344|nr:uncharacterized protein LOC127863864 isoform X2 [Dreissena polymorpha]
MARLGDVFGVQEMTNWLKAWLALNITKDGLHEFVDREVKQFQTGIYQNITSTLGPSANTTCTSCFTANILPCPTQGVCKKRGRKSCKSMHDTPSRRHRPCPLSICEAVRDHIKNDHRFYGPSWKNTSAEQWACNHWQIGKCFMPTDGYSGVTSIRDTDFNGVISVILNCKHFDNLMSFSIAPMSFGPCLLTKARDIGKAVRHSPSCEVTDSDLNDYFNTLETLLKDSKTLANDSSAQDAVSKLNLLRKESTISFAEMSHLLKDAHETLGKAENVTKECKSQMESYMEQLKTKLDEHAETLTKQHTKNFTEEANMFTEVKKANITEHANACTVESKTLINEYANTCTEGSKRNISEYTLTCTEESKINLTEHVNTLAKKSIQDIQGAISSKKESDYENEVKDFVRRLKQHYNLTMSHVSISTLLPSGDEFLYKIYATHAICRIVESNGGNKTENPITTYKEILCRGEYEKLHKRIFLQSEAGMGKTTFACKLVLDWCNPEGSLSSISKTFGDANTLQDFKLVLLITLRDSVCERDVTNMIKEQIIDMVYTDTERNDAYVMLNKIMQQEMCLVVQDGLDEWKDPQGKLAQPIMLSCYSQCTVLTTTRPWKLTDERIRQSQIDSLFELKGVSDPYELCKSLLDSFGCNTLNEFEQYVTKNRLRALLFSPMLISLIVSAWVDGTRLTGSRCDIYTVLIDGLFKKASENISFFVQPPLMCFQNTRYLQQHFEHLQAISKTAFLMLFSAEREHSLVISDRQLSQYLSQEQKDFALRTGVITERKCVSRTYQNSTCSFIHKSVQEFLAAVHIARNSADLAVVARYFTENSNAIFENQIFIFLCGLNILLANELSRIIDSTTTSEYLLSTYISGFIEAQANGQNPNDIDLKLSRFKGSYSDLIKCDASFRILQMNKSNAKLLQIGSYTDTIRLKRLIDDETVVREFDLSSFRNLESLKMYIGIELRPYVFHRLSQLKNLNLHACECKGLDLSSCHRLEVLDIFGGEITLKPNALNGLAQLKKLELWSCKCTQLNLSSCHNLETIYLYGEGIALQSNAFHRLVQLKMLKLKDCECQSMDLSLSLCQGLVLGDKITLTPNALNGLAQLKKLELHACECKGLDLSSCHRLEVLDIIGGKIMLKPNALNGLAQLKNLKLWYCKCTQLNISSCHNMETINLHGEGIALQPNAFHRLAQLKMLKLHFCECQRIDLSLCQSLDTLHLVGDKITLTPNALNGLAQLKKLELHACECKGLDLSSCHRLEVLDIIGGEIMLKPNALNGLAQLKNLKLWYCKCTQLNISSCHNMETINLHGEGIALQPNAFHRLAQLKMLKLHFCECQSMDLSLCQSLETLHLVGDKITLTPNALNWLAQLKKLNMQYCECKGLDLSSCHRLEVLDIIGSKITLKPNALNGLAQLKKLKLCYCKCTQLNLSSCHNMETIDLDGVGIALQPNAFHRLAQLKMLKLQGCECKSMDLSLCQSLEKLDLSSDRIRIHPNALHGLAKLKILTLEGFECKLLDLSQCPNLKTIHLCNRITLKPNTIHGHAQLKIYNI